MYITKKTSGNSVHYYADMKVKNKQGLFKEKRISLGSEKKLKEEADNDLYEFIKTIAQKIADFLKKEELEEAETSDEIPDMVGGEVVNLGILYLLWFMKFFTIDDFIDLMQKHSRSRHKLSSILNFCVGFRLFDPGSIRYECEMNGQWPVPEEIKDYDVYRALDEFYDLSEAVQHILWLRTSDYVKDKNGEPLILLFDGSNLYTFMRTPEEDLYDPVTKKLIFKAFRTKGMSKENRPEALVGLGLFVREGGMPIAWSEQPGNRPEIAYLPEELKKIMETFRPKQFILVADRGNWSGKVISTVLSLDKNTGSDNFYIIGRGIRKATKDTQQWAADEKGEFEIRYIDDKDKEKTADLKVRIINQPIKCMKKNGKTETIEIPQMEIVRYSAVYARREKHKREKTLKKAEEKEKNPGAVTHDLNKGEERFLDITVEDKDVKKAKNRKVKVNKEKAAQEEKLDGLYLITTNMIRKPPELVLRIYKELKFAEQDFRILKSGIRIRPFFMRKQEHICAVLDFSVIALYALRVFREMLKDRFTAEKILRDITSYAAVREDDGRYIVIGKPEVIKELEKITGVEITHRHLSQKDLIKIFTPKKSWMGAEL